MDDVLYGHREQLKHYRSLLVVKARFNTSPFPKVVRSSDYNGIATTNGSRLVFNF